MIPRRGRGPVNHVCLLRKPHKHRHRRASRMPGVNLLDHRCSIQWLVWPCRQRQATHQRWSDLRQPRLKCQEQRDKHKFLRLLSRGSRISHGHRFRLYPHNIPGRESGLQQKCRSSRRSSRSSIRDMVFTLVLRYHHNCNRSNNRQHPFLHYRQRQPIISLNHALSHSSSIPKRHSSNTLQTLHLHHRNGRGFQMPSQWLKKGSSNRVLRNMCPSACSRSSSRASTMRNYRFGQSWQGYTSLNK